MDNALTCTLCLNTFNSSNRIPRILKCGHTFCSKCLESLCNTSSSSSSSSRSLYYIPCPYDKSIGHPNKDINEIPINRILIDLIDYSGTNLSSLSISTTSSLNQPKSYLASAFDTLIQLKDKLTTQYDKLYSLMSLLQNEKVQLVKLLNQQYDFILNKLKNERSKQIAAFEQYIEAKVESFASVSKTIDRNRRLAIDALNKIKTLQTQTIKTISFSDELEFVNKINIDAINDKETNEVYANIEQCVQNHLLFPQLYIKNEIFENIEVLTNSIRVIYPSTQYHYNNKGVSSDINSIQINQLTISNNFYWFQPNSSNIYKYQIDTNTWSPIENKSSMAITEMFRVCQLNSQEALITGGVTNRLSSKQTILFNDGNFAIKDDMFTARRAHGTCLLNDEVYVCGGIDSQGESISQCEKYSLSEQKWHKVADLLTQRSHLSICAFNNCKVFSFGGDINESLVDYIDCYNPVLDQWTLLPITLPFKIECCGVIQVNKEDMMILGGYSNNPEAVKKVLIFNEPSFKVIIASKELSENGWSVHNPIKIGSVVHLICGGERSQFPNHIKYSLA